MTQTRTQNFTEAGIDPATAMARLEITYGMTEYGARLVLDDARMNGSARTLAATVTLLDRYPERFEVTASA